MIPDETPPTPEEDPITEAVVLLAKLVFFLAKLALILAATYFIFWGTCAPIVTHLPAQVEPILTASLIALVTALVAFIAMLYFIVFKKSVIALLIAATIAAIGIYLMSHASKL